MEVEIDLGPALRLGRPEAVFTPRPFGRGLQFGWPVGFDVTPDEKQFLIISREEHEEIESGIIVVENWFEEFAQAE